MPFISTSVSLDHMMPPHDHLAVLMLPAIYSNAGGTHVARSGMITDGASVPRLFWRIIPPFRSPYLAAAMIHDHYCYKSLSLPARSESRFRLRLEADQLFREMCGELGAGWAMQQALYRAVRIGSRRAQSLPCVPDYITDPDGFREWRLAQ